MLPVPYFLLIEVFVFYMMGVTPPGISFNNTDDSMVSVGRCSQGGSNPLRLEIDHLPLPTVLDFLTLIPNV